MPTDIGIYTNNLDLQKTNTRRNALSKEWNHIHPTHCLLVDCRETIYKWGNNYNIILFILLRVRVIMIIPFSVIITKMCILGQNETLYDRKISYKNFISLDLRLQYGVVLRFPRLMIRLIFINESFGKATCNFTVCLRGEGYPSGQSATRAIFVVAGDLRVGEVDSRFARGCILRIASPWLFTLTTF